MARLPTKTIASSKAVASILKKRTTVIRRMELQTLAWVDHEGLSLLKDQTE